MPIPADILAVERLKNTVVIAYGKDKSLYAVRQRVGCKNVNGRHLRVCNPGIKDNELKEAYDNGFLSELYPGVALSKNTVSTFLGNLGKNCSRTIRFMRNRTASVGIDHHLLIDGTLKSNESKVNTLSDSCPNRRRRPGAAQDDRKNRYSLMNWESINN